MASKYQVHYVEVSNFEIVKHGHFFAFKTKSKTYPGYQHVSRVEDFNVLI